MKSSYTLEQKPKFRFDPSRMERLFVQIFTVTIFFLCGWWLKDQGEPGRSIHIKLIFGTVSGALLTTGLLLSLLSVGKRFWLLTILLLMPSGLAAAFVMTAYGWTPGILTLVFYIYVIFSISTKRWKP